MKFRLIKSLLVLILVSFFVAGCGSEKVEIPSEITDGYILGNYETYVEKAKINGKKYDKLYVVGKFVDDPFEDGDLISCYFFDENNRKYLLKMDIQNTNLKTYYTNLKNKQICVCGVYGGSLIKEKMPIIYINKIYDIKNKKTLESQYYGKYYGNFDENGKVISTDYNETDNTTIDFHSIQLQVPYNYMERTLDDTTALYQIQDDGVFFIDYKKSDMSDILSDFSKKYTAIENLKVDVDGIAKMYNSMLGNVNISSIRDDSDYCTVSYDISNNDLYGNGVIILKDDGIYLVTLLTDKKSRFNRSQDFSKIIKSLETLNHVRQPKSTGINKMVTNKNNSLNIDNIKIEEYEINTSATETIEVEKIETNGSDLVDVDNTIVEMKNIEEKVEKKDFLEEIKNTINGAIGENEKFNEIKVTNKNIYISVDLSNINEVYSGFKKDLAISRIESITDDILRLKDYFNEWDSIIVDFGNIGNILLDKSQIATNPYGMYFDFTDDMLNTNKKDLNSVSKNIDISNYNTKSLKEVNKNNFKLQFGEILEVNGFYGDIIVIKVKYTPALSKQDYVEQGNFMNIEDLIQNQGLDNASEIQYWAVADMISGDESKYISFDIPSDLISDIKNGRILAKEFFNRVKNYWLLPSIKN